MSSRFTARLDDDLAEWVNSEAEERDRPKAWVLSEAIRAAKGDESTYAHRGGADSTATHQPDGDGDGATRTGEHRDGAERTDGELRERVDDLEERVAELEAREESRDALAGERYTVGAEDDDDDDSPEGGDESHAVPARGDARDQPTDASTGPTESESAETGAPAEGDLDADVLEALQEFVEDHPPHKAHAKRAVVETVLALRGEGTMSTGELQEAVYEEVAEEYTDARTMWNSLSRYVEDIPGVEKAGYGEWAYPGDDAVRDAVDAP